MNETTEEREARRQRHFGGKAPKPLKYKQLLPHMEEWLENLTADGVSDTYINAAHTGLKHFTVFCEQEDIKHPDEIERRHLLRYQTYLSHYVKDNGAVLSLSYRTQLMKYLRNWIGWMVELKYVTEDPWVRIKLSYVGKKPKPFDEHEVEAMFDAHRRQAFTLSPFNYHRRETILVLLYGWGLRLNELCSLTVQQMDMRLDYVEVRNKARAGSSNGTKVLPYSNELKRVVQRYLATRGRYAQVGRDELFISRYGKPMDPEAIRRVLRDLGDKAGVRINPHRLRDTFGTTMLDNDVPLEQIMKMMGHSSKEQTLAYAKVRDRKLKESHERVVTPLINKLLEGRIS